MNRPGPEKLLTRSGPDRHGRSHKNKKQTLGRNNMQFRLNFCPTALAAFGLLAAAAAFSAGAHAADEWPARDIAFYVPYAPGGSTDPISRKYAELLEKQLKVKVIVEKSSSPPRTSGAEPAPTSWWIGPPPARSPNRWSKR
jgi:hypothetical protein